jgi:hypothetical protein
MLPTFAGISVVVSDGAENQVRGVVTARHITTVPDAHALRDWAVVLTPGQNVQPNAAPPAVDLDPARRSLSRITVDPALAHGR